VSARIRAYAPADRAGVGAVARAAFAQYVHDYEDWPGFIDGIGRQLVTGCLRLAFDAGAPVVGLHTSPIMGSALRMYEAIGFVRDRDLAPIRGVPYGRYVLPAAEIPSALELLNA
jgi:GNAT superfamily N-acetyltransferase